MFASCQKEAPTADIQQPSQSGLDVITATSSQTKTTTLDGVNVLWEKGDAIKLFTRTHNPADPENPTAGWCDYNSTLQEPSATATFERDASNTATVDNTSGKYLAVYCKNATINTQSRKYYTQIYLHKEQVAKNGGDFAASIMYATSENTEFAFKHIVSYIKFTVDANTTPFKKLTITTDEDSKYVVSRIQVDFASEPVVEVLPLNPSSGALYSQSSKTVTLVTDDGESFAPGTYYLAINPDQYAEGLKLTFDNGASTYTISTPTNITLNAGEVATLGTIGTLNFPELGDVYAENGVNQGVVFWVDQNDSKKGLIISGQYSQLVWDTDAETNGTKYDWAANINTEDGLANQNYVLNNVQGSTAEKFPAVYFCKNMGDGWRLPTINEMKDVNRLYQSDKDAFNAALSQCCPDETLEKGSATWYWTGQSFYSDSDPSNSGKIGRVKIAASVSSGGAWAKNSLSVRCVREVTLN